MLAIDLFCGLGGWTEALLAEGWDVIGFDIERHVYGESRYPTQLVLQDVLTLDGAQFRNADLIVASPPCQEFSYMAMPWSRGKQIAAALRGQGEFPEGYEGSRTIGQLTALFDACFRIQREASEVAGHRIPMVVENVKGAQPWVGRAKANYGSFYLWGDVDSIGGRIVRAGAVRFGEPAVKAHGRRIYQGRKGPGGDWFEDGRQGQDAYVEAVKVGGLDWSKHGDPDYKPQGFNVTAAQRWREEHDNGVKCTGQKHGEEYAMTRGATGTKQNGSGPEWFDNGIAKHFSRSDSRKAASAQIAKIPRPLAEHIARIYKPAYVIESRA